MQVSFLWHPPVKVTKFLLPTSSSLAHAPVLLNPFLMEFLKALVPGDTLSRPYLQSMQLQLILFMLVAPGVVSLISCQISTPIHAPASLAPTFDTQLNMPQTKFLFFSLISQNVHGLPSWEPPFNPPSPPTCFQSLVMSSLSPNYHAKTILHPRRKRAMICGLWSLLLV